MIYYFTRTQKSKVAADALHEITGLPLYALTAPINEVKGFSFVWRAVKSVLSSKGCPVDNLPTDVPSEIYICGPIWAGGLAGPLKYFVKNIDLTHTKVNVLLTGQQPAEQSREMIQKFLAKSGCKPCKIFMMATSKELPEKDVVLEHLRQMLEEEA